MSNDPNTFVRLADVAGILDRQDVDSRLLDGIERFTLIDGYERNEAGINELVDANGDPVGIDQPEYSPPLL